MIFLIIFTLFPFIFTAPVEQTLPEIIIEQCPSLKTDVGFLRLPHTKHCNISWSGLSKREPKDALLCGLFFDSLTTYCIEKQDLTSLPIDNDPGQTFSDEFCQKLAEYVQKFKYGHSEKLTENVCKEVCSAEYNYVQPLCHLLYYFAELTEKLPSVPASKSTIITKTAETNDISPKIANFNAKTKLSPDNGDEKKPKNITTDKAVPNKDVQQKNQENTQIETNKPPQNEQLKPLKTDNKKVEPKLEPTQTNEVSAEPEIDINPVVVVKENNTKANSNDNLEVKPVPNKPDEKMEDTKKDQPLNTKPEKQITQVPEQPKVPEKPKPKVVESPVEYEETQNQPDQEDGNDRAPFLEDNNGDSPDDGLQNDISFKVPAPDIKDEPEEQDNLVKESNAQQRVSKSDEPINNDMDIDEGDSYFFQYFMILCLAVIVGYVAYHNKQKILGLIVEGHRGKRQYRSRRPNSANYHKLDTNLEEAISSSCSKNTTNIIY